MSTAISSASGLPEAEHDKHLRRVLIASTVGTTIEWYDFLLYGTVTGLVFGKLFFPGSEPFIGVLRAFIGFVDRPIGAAIFGHFGGPIGRKATLITTLLLTGIATVAVGLVPTYAKIATWGALLLTSSGSFRGSASVANGAARYCWRWNGARGTTIGA